MQFLASIHEDKYDRYKKNQVVGEGTFGVVYHGFDKVTQQVVAVKKIRMGQSSNNGIGFSAIREIKVLQELKHENVIELFDVFLHKSNIYLVYEFIETDLHAIITDTSIVLSPSDVKGYMHSIMKGLASCHNNWILHRDMKPSNILVSQFGDVKLADFGLAKVFGSPDKRYSPQCVTLWYKPPELLFGATLYGPSVDMWSMGCIFAELLLRRPLLPGSNDLDQLGKIFATFGTPTEQEWPQMKSLPNYIEYEDCPKVPLKSLFVAASDDALDLLSKMLVYDPNKRITATEALEHPYFKNQPRPSLNKDLPLPQKVKKNRDEKIQVQPASTNGKGKILSFDDDLNTTTSDMNLSGYTNATDTSANLSGMVDDSFEAPTPASTAEKRRREPDEHDDMYDDIDGDGERPTVRRKLAL